MSGNFDLLDAESVRGWAGRLQGRTLGEAMTSSQRASWSASGGKGDVGLAVEHYFDISQNSDHAPDFAELGLELKVAPLRLDPEGLTAKERVSITAINYGTIADEAFDGSALDLKTRRVLFVFYEWQADQDPLEARVHAVMWWDRDGFADHGARDCHDYVRTRVAAGQAHLITSKHTAVVEPATKGQKGGEWHPPGGGRPAKPRAFAFKRDYVHVLWRGAGVAASDPDPYEAAEEFRRFLRRRILEHRGQSVREIDARLGLGVNMGAKHAHRLVANGIITRIRGVDLDEDEVPIGGLEQLERLGITPKVVRLAPDGTPRETPPFAGVGFDRIAETPFEQSRLAIETSEIMWILWSGDGRVPDSRLLDIGYWIPTDEERASIRADYESARAAISASDPEGLPRAADVESFHVRTKGTDAQDVGRLPDGRLATRRGFYMNKPFARRVVAEARAAYDDAP